MKHEWFEVSFTYASWVECTCGFRPDSEAAMAQHSRENA